MLKEWTLIALNYKPWSTTEGAVFLDKLSDCKLLIITYSL